jgi:undecaprenyl-diphosphatase
MVGFYPSHNGAVDESLFRWINEWPQTLEPVFLFFSEGNKWTPVRLGLLAVALGFAIYRPTRTAVLLALLAWPLANAMSDVLKFSIQMPRPCVTLHDVILRVQMMTSPGMPSAHSANMAAVATAFTIRAGPWWGAPWVAVALLTGLSRVYVGVHFPSQVFAGWMTGVFAAWLLATAGRALVRMRSDPASEPAEGK